MTITVNREYNVHYNKKRIRRLMQILHLKSVCRRKRYNYIQSTPEVTAENILNRDFHADKPNEKWLTDVTEFKYYVGVEVRKIYLSAILDLYDRRIVSYRIGDSNNNSLVFATFDEAVKANPDAHPLFHSDRGFQYTSKSFHDKLIAANMRQSMSRVGRCIDNGPMEGFWGILKSEMYYLRKFTSRDDLISAIERYLHFYNNKRYQQRLRCMTPMEFQIKSFCFFHCLLDRGHFISEDAVFFCVGDKRELRRTHPGMAGRECSVPPISFVQPPLVCRKNLGSHSAFPPYFEKNPPLREKSAKSP